ncbi:uncharacterized protein LOC131952485 isoform X2 [Physella acuta]|uniref:uncharacterized protein LOC131952485 isoform X2 n=1 Tax=Physella acuta TaxID=109671 RepID=UPI0027DB9FFA|nr:uncharacterized protein LOC131952485 isoform X2 [Physella acuta]
MDAPKPMPRYPRSIGLPMKMDRKKGSPGRNRNVFRGSVLVSILVESHPKQFPDRAAAFKLGQRLFREGQIRSIFGSNEFQDSAQLYVWCDDDGRRKENEQTMTSPTSSSGSFSSASQIKSDLKLIQDIKDKVLNRSEAYNIVTSYNTFFQELEQDFGLSHDPQSSRKVNPAGSNSYNVPYTSTLEHKKSTVYSTDSSVETPNNSGQRGGANDDLHHLKPGLPSPHSKHSADTSPRLVHDGRHLSQKVNHIPQSIPELSNNSPHTPGDSALRAQPAPSTNKKGIHSSQEAPPHLKHAPNQTPTNHIRPQQLALVTPDTPRSDSQTDSTIVGEDRLGKNIKSDTKQPPVPANMDFDVGSSNVGTISSQVSSVVAEGSDNTTIPQAAGDAVHSRNNNWTQGSSFSHAATPFKTKWTEPSSVTPNTNLHYASSEIVDRVESSERSRWLDVVNEGGDNGRRWPESTNSYSDNEKQLLEEMRRMKKEHQNTLRTYEGRINKLMAKMHELRNIAEMLENSSNKSSPYGVLPGKLALLNILGDKDLDMKKLTPISGSLETDQVPPPLPPRPGRGTKVYPNKPIIHTAVSMRNLSWSRIILEDNGGEPVNTVWHGMIEPKIDTTELERLFSSESDIPSDVTLYDDICLRRGRTKSQVVTIYDADRSQRIISELKSLHCKLHQVIQAFATLNCNDLHTDSFAELLELLASQRELDKIQHHVKRKGAGHLDIPEFLVFELSKVDHFRERLEFLRFKNKLQINLFEIDQQLRELHTACEEITTSLSLKHVLETVLAVGNYMNAGTDKGQADGFKIDGLKTLKEIEDPSKQCNLLEVVMRIYCQVFESDLEFGCPTRFRLPEPSIMRHAAQVSFEDIQRALKELKEELFFVKNKLESLTKREGNTVTIALRVTSENFMVSAMEMLADEQKLLDNTRVYFWKTAAFYSHDGRQSTPNDFFQIWASFLHDCKYYWKLAHRNLTKAKFNKDLAVKNDAPSTSPGPSFTTLKSALIKHMSAFDQEQAKKAQRLQHINSWIESVEKYSPGLQAEAAGFLPVDIQPQTNQRQFPEEVHQPEDTSPPYINQPAIQYLQDRNSESARFQRNKPDQDNFINRNENHLSYPDTHDRTSPKPIKATPPNVIKPKPITHASPSLSSPSSNSAAQAGPVVPSKPELKVDTNNNRNKIIYQDDFGFEPLYESLPNPGATSEDHAPNLSENISFSPPLSSPKSPDLENTHKKNANFFKSLLKRDQKRSPGTDEHTSHKSVSAPINKLRQNFFQKLSGGGSSKKSEDSKTYPPKASPSNESPVKPLRSLPRDQPTFIPLDLQPEPENKNLPNLEEARKNINYQNYLYKEQQRSNEVPPIPYRPENLEEAHGKNFHENQEPLSLSSKDRANPINKEHLTHNERECSPDTKKNSDKLKNSDMASHRLRNNLNIDGADGSGGRSSGITGKPRVRAPIALGSNMSISEAYGKSTEPADHNGQGNSDFQQTHSSKERVPADPSFGHSAPRTSNPDPKWVKANPVPVYKAKLIPNYENQTKYDPHFGVRGQAEAPAQVPHTNSDFYRQELQKKSELYVGNGSYPSPNYKTEASGSSSNKSPNPNQYHASPIVVSRDGYVNSFANEQTRNAGSHVNSNDHLVDSQKKNYENQFPQHGQSRAYADHSPQQSRQSSKNVDRNFNHGPDGWRGVATIGPGVYTNSENKNKPQGVPRSSSAHDVLDRDVEQHSRKTQAQRNPENPEMKPPYRISRRDIADKKITPNSHREYTNNQDQNGQSVTTLIDRFEKKPDFSRLGLIDMDDKPPSMTSTPVARRRVMLKPQDDLSKPASRATNDHTRSKSAGGVKASPRDQVPNSHMHNGQSHNSKQPLNSQDLLQGNLKSPPFVSRSPHQAVAPFYIQPSGSSRPHSQERHSNHVTTLENYNYENQRGTNPHSYHREALHHDSRNYTEIKAEDQIQMSNLKIHSQPSSDRGRSEPRQSKPHPSHHSPRQDKNNHFSTPSSHHTNPPPSHHSNPPPSHHSNPPSSHHNNPPPSHHTNPPSHHSNPPPSHHSNPPPSHHTNPPPSHHTNPPPSHHNNPPPSHHSNPPSHHTNPPPSHHTNPPPSHHTNPPPSHHTNPHSNPTPSNPPKPAARQNYPKPQPYEDPAPTQQHPYPQDPPPNDQQPYGHTQSTIVQPQPHRQQQTVLPSYTPALDPPDLKPPPSSSNTIIHQTHYGNPPYNNSNDEVLHAQYFKNVESQRPIKSSNSAFERPLKPGASYGRQPGALAVVKPTVMNI